MLSETARSSDSPMSARVLLIDDDARLTSMVSTYLVSAGLHVSVAGDLAQGARACSANSSMCWCST